MGYENAEIIILHQTKNLTLQEDIYIYIEELKNYEELGKIIIRTTVEEIGLFEKQNNEVYTNKNIKEAQKLKTKAKKEYEMAIRMKKIEQIKNKLDQYKKH